MACNNDNCNFLYLGTSISPPMILYWKFFLQVQAMLQKTIDGYLYYLARKSIALITTCTKELYIGTEKFRDSYQTTHTIKINFLTVHVEISIALSKPHPVSVLSSGERRNASTKCT